MLSLLIGSSLHIISRLLYVKELISYHTFVNYQRMSKYVVDDDCTLIIS